MYVFVGLRVFVCVRGMAKAAFRLLIFITVKPLQACFASGTGQVFCSTQTLEKEKNPTHMYYTYAYALGWVEFFFDSATP